jgi:hypothetical protein
MRSNSAPVWRNASQFNFQSMPERPTHSDPAASVDDEVTSLSPRTRYRLLSVFWIFPSAGAVWILWNSPAGSGRLMERLQGITLEGWAAVALLLVHAFFICNALFASASVQEPERKEVKSNS